MLDNMDNSKLIDLIQSEIRNGQSFQQFTSNNVPNHVHNGIDSPRVNMADLLNGIISGSVKLTAGNGTITDSRIQPTSIIVVCPTSSIEFISPANVYLFGAQCFQGSASIFGGGPARNDTVNYLIKL